MTLLERLKAETADVHEETEAAVALPSRLTDEQSYRALLERFYGFHAAWEPRMDACATGAHLIADRRKLALLERDLGVLGHSAVGIAALPRCEGLSVHAEAADTLGAFYVVEGSSLGGAVIASEVRRRLGLDASTGCSFFGCYGAATARKWQEFGASFLALARGVDEARVVSAARETFGVMRTWLAD